MHATEIFVLILNVELVEKIKSRDANKVRKRSTQNVAKTA